MLRRDRQIRTQIGQLKDGLLCAVSLWLAHALRDHFPSEILFWKFEPIDPFDRFMWLFLIIFPGAPLVLESVRFYQRPLFGSRVETAWLLFKGCFIVASGVILFLFLWRYSLARGVIVLFAAISFLLVFASEELMRVFYRSRLGVLQIKKRMLLVGSDEDRQRLRDDIQAKGIENIDIVGELDLNLSTIPGLAKLLHQTSANGVIINARHTVFGEVEKAIQACEIEGKQILDLALAFILVVLLLPLWILVPLAIRLTSPGAVLFRQRRCGLNGQPFTMIKFRSMITDAEQRKQELAALNEMGGPVFKLSNDPRTTPVGRILRKYSIDEFPQLFNVLRGEMSLVGPRPLPVDEVARFDDPAHRRRLSVKPGLTCLWQISGRNNVRDFKDWVRLDLEYIDNWSLWLDLKILWRTIPVVLSGTGAK